jgi:hypothetical protein
MSRTPALLSSLVLAAACGSATEPRAPVEPAHLAIYIGDLHIDRGSSLGMLPGNELHFAVRLTDAAGNAVPGLHSNIISRSPLAVSMDTLGIARVAGKGSSWIVASVLTPAHNLLADSTLVQVLCTVGALPAISLTVEDSVTGQSGPLVSLKIKITNGTLSDTAFVNFISAGAPLFILPMAYERAGVYDLAVTADGYKPWSRSGITVTADICHVTTVPILARLQAQ